MAFLITYLPADTERNTRLLQRIKQYNAWAIINPTNFIVKEDGKKASDIRSELVPYMRGNDKVLVSELTGNAAWRALDENMSAWLKRNL